jgi:hypothetical protein
VYMYESNDVEWDKILDAIYEDEAVREEIKKRLLELLIHGDTKTFHNNGDNNLSIWPNALDSRKMGVVSLKADPPTSLPKPVCKYRKAKVYWFGELHGSNNLTYNPHYTGARHWEVKGDRVETFKGKRFIAISEPTEAEQVDSDFLKRFTGDEWVETRTLKGPHKWEPQGEIFVMSGRPLKINNKDKDTLEQVAAISYPPAE